MKSEESIFRVSEETREELDNYRAFVRNYCEKCGKNCDTIDESSLRYLDDGTLGCTRYVCSVLWEGWK